MSKAVRSRARSSRWMGEMLVTGAATVVVAGVLLGTGFAQTVLAATDGLTWLGDDTRGEAILINPTTGRPEARLTVTPPGDPLHIAQTDTLLVVTDTATGAVTIIDPATLATTGTWHGTGNRTKVLLTATELYGGGPRRRHHHPPRPGHRSPDRPAMDHRYDVESQTAAP